MHDLSAICAHPQSSAIHRDGRLPASVADRPVLLRPTDDQPLVLGLIGAIGAGKSTVAKMLGDLGCQVFDADKAGHEVLSKPAIARRIVESFGNDIVDASGVVDRRKVGRIVFDDPGKRLHLESIVHPAIRELFESAKSTAKASGIILVLEAPVLLEAGWNDACHFLVFVDAPRELRMERLRARGWNEAELTRREAAQWPNEKKRAIAQFHVTNDGSMDACRRQVNQILDRVRQLHVKGAS